MWCCWMCRGDSMATTPVLNWKQILASLGPAFAGRAAAYDGADAFVAENYAEMRAAKLFSALVPQELGGGGLSYSEVCGLLRGLGQFCGSTALAFSMHQHLIATRAMELPPRQTRRETLANRC